MPKTSAVIKKEISSLIYLIRGQRVMLDSDLAELYCVETGHLNRAVRRNKDRFPGILCFGCQIKNLPT